MDSIEEPLLCSNPNGGDRSEKSRSYDQGGTLMFNIPKGNQEEDKHNLNTQYKNFSDLYKAKYMIPILFIITNIMLFLVASTDGGNHSKRSKLSGTFLRSNPEGTDEHGENDDSEHLVEEETVEIPNVVLFPWFAQLIGILAYYFISRYAHGVPYTAVMFIVGSSLGFVAQRSSSHSAVIESTSMWLGINGEVILLTFLPGLLYLDSYNVNVYLFVQAFWQLFTFAFPMVLGGTALTALVAYYIFPYGWSFDLCMTFGSILAATDPVAVAVLLNELGAPPRLKIHISGESLMNDGSAVVFYHIFSSRFFYELGVPGFGEEIGWGRGFALFFRLALGGACIGLAFGLGLVTLLFWLHRRLSAEENVIQVTATITTAYLVFYVSEILAGCSGIIAVLFCGLTAKALGDPLINDPHLTHDFWHIAEHLLNTTLFTLGGAVWGGIIGNPTATEKVDTAFHGLDWVYLLILFGLVTVIRFLLVFLFYPLTSRIGIGQNWREAVFMSYGGLRGAVGIALALALNAEVFHISEAIDEEKRHQFRDFADHLFGMVGGIAFLTLVVNGPTSGPLLKKLGLVTPTETREKIVENYETHMKHNTLVEYVALLAQQRFEKVDYAVIKSYVSPLRTITKEEVNSAVATFKQTHPKESPNLSNLIQHLSALDDDDVHPLVPDDSNETPSRPVNYRSESVANLRKQQRELQATVYDLQRGVDDTTLSEQRVIFIDLLRREYERQIEDGELDARGFMPFSLLQSLDFAEDAASKGHPLNDWSACQSVSDVFTSKADKLLHIYRFKDMCKRNREDEDFQIIRTKVLQALSFIRAHEAAQKTFKAEFASTNEQSLTAAEKMVLDESRHQVELADETVHNFDEEDVTTIKSQFACQILLNKSANYFEKLAHHGLMTEKEANEFLERYGHELRRLQMSTGLKADFRRLSQLSPSQLEANIKGVVASGSTTAI